MNKQFGALVFWRWIMKAVVQGLLILYGCMFISQYHESAIRFDGKVQTFWAAGHFVYLTCVCTAQIVLFRLFNNHSGWGELIMVLSIATYFIAVLVEA